MSEARSSLLRLINGFQASHAIHVAAALGLADKLSDSPKSPSVLASKVGADPDALHRLMRVLAAIGVLQPSGSDDFALTAMGQFLRGDVLGTCAPMAELLGRPNVWQAWGELLHTVRTGGTAFDHVHGCGVWEYRTRHPEEGAVFDRAMATGTARFAQAMLDVCDFGRLEHVVDIGGGDGAFLTMIMERYPLVHGTLFDQPHVIARATAPQSGGASNGRYSAVGG
ncbi:MAG: methyltransferase, partial [Beijerinckiaceae bacterium]